MDEQGHVAWFESKEDADKAGYRIPLDPNLLAMLDKSTGYSYDVKQPHRIELYNKRCDELLKMGIDPKTVMEPIYDKKAPRNAGIRVATFRDTKKHTSKEERRKKNKAARATRRANRK